MSEVHDIKTEQKKYIKVFVGLLILTIITVWISYFNVAVALAVALALVVATMKASLVASFFMHLIAEKKAIYILLGFTVFFFAGMMFLTVMGYYDTPQGTKHLIPEAGTTAPVHSDNASGNGHSADEGGHH